VKGVRCIGEVLFIDVLHSGLEDIVLLPEDVGLFPGEKVTVRSSDQVITPAIVRGRCPYTR
jgi:hypothetical protein